MTRRRKDPLRDLTDDGRRHLTRLRRSTAAPAAHVARATMLLAVADGADYQAAARAAGRKSGDAVSHLVARFNREGVAALDPRHGGGHTPTYDIAARQRILREVARTPTREADGTATWSLATLRRVLRAAPDGLPTVSTFTIWRVLRGAGYTSQQGRTWCPTGSAVRRRKAAVVTVTDPDAGPQKSCLRTPTRSAPRSASRCGRGRGRAVPGGPAPRPVLAAGGPAGPAAARVRPRRHSQGADAVPAGRRARPS